jgi:fumarate hydratase class II
MRIVKMEYRREKDVLGEIKVPKNVYWGINTQRAVENYKISGKKFPPIFIQSLAEIKKACLHANRELNLISESEFEAILKAVDEIILENKLFNQFPIDIFQTGSGTATNMNMNEVLANRANEILGFPIGKKRPIHPNDHINLGQSSNDVIPSAMNLSTVHFFKEKLLPVLEKLADSLTLKIQEFTNIVKVGRTHLQDAVPIPLSLEFQVYHSQIENSIKRLHQSIEELLIIPIGGTAVGTGLNSSPEFAQRAIQKLNEITGYYFKEHSVKAESIASHNVIAHASSILRTLALSLIKMANDIRWMGSGPRAGLSELKLPQNEPGSSIMPGKTNPTQSEMLIQVCLQVIGNDTSIYEGEMYGSTLDLNVCKPLMIFNLLESIEILNNGILSFIENCLIDLEVNIENIESQLNRLLMTVTRLSPLIGYDKCAYIAQKAYKEGKTIKEVVVEENIEIKGNLDELLNPKKMV